MGDENLSALFCVVLGQFRKWRESTTVKLPIIFIDFSIFSIVLENPFGCECGAGEFGAKGLTPQLKSVPGPLTNRIVNGYESKRK